MASKSRPKKIVAVSGYFNPVHVGHLEMIEKAKKLGDTLIAIINNDEQVRIKGSIPFMSQRDRMRIVGALKAVDKVVLSIDKDKSVCKTLAKLKPNIFAKGGDRTLDNIPEANVCRKNNIKMVFGLGKKIRSSSIFIANSIKNHKETK